MKRFFSILFFSCFLLGCTQFVEKSSEAANEGIYGIPAAINNGRIDKADIISQDLKTLYPAPQHPINSPAILDPKTNLPYVILPARLTGVVIVIGTSEYQDLLKNKVINKELTQDNQSLIDYKKSADAQKLVNDQVQNALLKKMNAYEASIFYKAYVKWTEFKWFSIIGVALSIIVFFALLIWTPEAIPFILKGLGFIVARIWLCIKGIFSFFLQKS